MLSRIKEKIYSILASIIYVCIFIDVYKIFTKELLGYNLKLIYIIIGFISGLFVVLFNYISERKILHKKKYDFIKVLVVAVIYVLTFISPITAVIKHFLFHNVDYDFAYFCASSFIYFVSFYCVLFSYWSFESSENKNHYLIFFVIPYCFIVGITQYGISVPCAIALIASLYSLSLDKFTNVKDMGESNLILSTLFFSVIIIISIIGSSFVSVFNPIKIYYNVKNSVEEINNTIKEELNGNNKQYWNELLTLDNDKVRFISSMSFDNKDEEDRIIMNVDTYNYDIDRLKYMSYGAYNEKRHCFVLKDFYNISYEKFMFTKDNTNHAVIVEDIVGTRNRYFPYGLLNTGLFHYGNYYDRGLEKKEVDERTYQYYVDENINKNEIYPYFDEATTFYTKVPTRLGAELKNFLSNNGIDYSDSNKEILIERINNLLLNEYTYAENVEEVKGKNDPISEFLHNSKKGHSMHFASAATLLYRVCDIPARYTVGYLVGEDGVVTDSDAHAWVEVLDREKCWRVVEVTPGFSQVDVKETEDIENVEEIINSEMTNEISNGDDNSEDEQINNVEFELEEIDNQDTTAEDSSGEGSGSEGSTGGSGSGGSGALGLSNATITNASAQIDENPVMIIVKSTNNEVTRLKKSAYGDFDYETSTFKLEEDNTNYPSYNSIDFKRLFLNNNENYLNHRIVVNTMFDTNIAYVPYANIYGNNLTAIEDKYYKFNETKDKYELAYHYLDEKQYFKNNNYKDYVYEKYLNVPAQLETQLQDYLTNNNIDYTAKDKNELINKITEMYANDFTYTLSPEELPVDQNVIMYFLNNTKSGYCMHYASSATLLFRVCGIPARYCDGYMVNKYDENGIGYCYASGSHAWVEVYTDGNGWMPVEVTLGDILDPSEIPSIGDEQMEIEEPKEEDNINTEEELDDEEAIEINDLSYDVNEKAPLLLRIVTYINVVVLLVTIINVVKKIITGKLKIIGKQKYQYMNEYYHYLQDKKYKVNETDKTMERIKFSLDELENEDIKEFLDYISESKRFEKYNKKAKRKLFKKWKV